MFLCTREYCDFFLCSSGRCSIPDLHSCCVMWWRNRPQIQPSAPTTDFPLCSYCFSKNIIWVTASRRVTSAGHRLNAAITKTAGRCLAPDLTTFRACLCSNVSVADLLILLSLHRFFFVFILPLFHYDFVVGCSSSNTHSIHFINSALLSTGLWCIRD